MRLRARGYGPVLAFTLTQLIASMWVGELSAQGLFAGPVYYSVGSQPHDVCVERLDSDNWPDLAVANRNSASVSVLLNNGDGTFQAANAFGVGVGPTALTACRLDDDPHLDIITSNSTSDNISVLTAVLNRTGFSL